MNIDITLTPAGWKLVPQVPTEEMMSAGLYQSSRGADYNDVCQAYMDMVKVAPEPPHDYETASVVGQKDSRDTYIDALAEEKTYLAAELAHLRRSAAMLDVARERSRQVDEEGWTPSHDDAHQDRSLALAAACYAMFASVSDEARASTEMPASLTVTGEAITGWSAWLEIWPWERRFWKPSDRRRDLVRAASLIVAEIERLDRAASSEEELHSPSDRSAPSIGSTTRIDRTSDGAREPNNETINLG